MYVQKKLMAKLEHERLADQANTYKQQQIHQQQLEALKTFASYQQMNSAQQQQQQQQFNTALQKEQLTAILTAMMNNNNFILNQQQQPPQSTTSLPNNSNKVNQSKNANQASRKRSHSDLDACSSSEEEPFCYAKKLRQPPSLGKINSLNSTPKNAINFDNKVDQNNNASVQEQTPVSTTTNLESNKQPNHYDSNHSDEEELDGKKQNKRGRNYRKMMIEKRRRDRINNSLNELRRLVPAAFSKQGSAKLEKAEILQMTVDHLKTLHAKGFDTFSIKPSKLEEFAVDYHTIGFRECANEVERYLTNEHVDNMVKERVISHLKKINTNNSKLSVNLNKSKEILNDKKSKKANKPVVKQENEIINQNQINNQISNQINNLQNLHNNLHNLHKANTINHHSINAYTPLLSPPSSSVSPLSTSSSSSITITSPNSLESSDSNQQFYIPYALLKSKKLPVKQLNNKADQIYSDCNAIKSFKTNEATQLQNLITLTNSTPLKCL